MTREEQAQQALTNILQLAHSGEMAAAFAYRGHGRSVSDPEERASIEEIEEEEWAHRRSVREMLDSLGATPQTMRERRAAFIGRTLGLLCHLGGWLAPMYGAGLLESKNIREYEAAARFALDCGRGEWLECLLTMAEVEWKHEAYFRAKVQSHWLGARLPLWKQPPPLESIREAFAEDLRTQVVPV